MRTAAPLAALLLLAGMPALAQQARVTDTLEQRLLACATCHGERGEGVRANQYYPRIAGKPAGYLYNQLVSFRDRRRLSPGMNYIVASLSDTYLREIAEHYAKLSYPQPPSQLTPAAEVVARGEALMLHGDRARDIPACAACHGKALTGMQPAIPGLVGLDPQYIAAQMGAWRNGTRRAHAPDCMAEVASRLVPGDISAIAAWLAQQSASNAPPLPAGSLKLPMDCGGLASLTGAKAEERKPPVPGSGEYLATAGNCLSCHTVPGGAPYAGGRPIPTPFGTLYSSNLTPDSDTGIGAWSPDDFWRALHEGRSKTAEFLYPAFPYTHYTRIVREDADKMFAFLRSLRPVRQERKAPDMRFPYDRRALLAGWRALYFRPGVYQPDPAQPAEWNRGAYLVEGLGHCSACHTSRNAWGAVPHGQPIAGGLIPMLNWYAPSLTANTETGLGDWSIEELMELLKTGVSARGAVFGPMAEVVRDSLQHLAEADLRAMIVYLKSQREDEPRDPGSGMRLTQVQQEALMARGARVYEDRCAACHGANGEGVSRVYPPLADNRAILMRNPINAVRMVLNGGFPPSTAGNPRPYGMPPFAHLLNDEDVAAVVTYVRGSWGNRSAPVSSVEASAARGVPAD